MAAAMAVAMVVAMAVAMEAAMEAAMENAMAAAMVTPRATLAQGVAPCHPRGPTCRATSRMGAPGAGGWNTASGGRRTWRKVAATA